MPTRWVPTTSPRSTPKWHAPVMSAAWTPQTRTSAGSRGGHFHIAYADRQHRYDSGPPLKLLAHRQGDLLAAPVGPHRRRADQGSHEVELCDGFGDALNERVADQQLALVDPDACAQRLHRRREFLREATVLVRITDEEGGLAGHISNLGD